jgi:protein gp37
MGTGTGISWADVTWNPWQGCTPVSEGCQKCYARRDMTRYGRDFTTVKRSAAQTFNLPLAKKRDGSWKIADGSFVFVCSWGDFFHENADEWRSEAFDIMLTRSGLTFLLLTKRPARIPIFTVGREGYSAWHIWLGVTAENQARADERIPKLFDIDWPGKRFLSVEPMLGHVNLMKAREGFFFGNYLRDYIEHKGKREWADLPLLDWIICGGESGPNARPMKLEWARSLRDQCKAAGVPFHMKQLGGWPDKRKKLEDLPEDLRIRERP